jgi:exopolysaccharide biosynthesis polyprenyl glycosylphosphotransferase
MLFCSAFAIIVTCENNSSTLGDFMSTQMRAHNFSIVIIMMGAWNIIFQCFDLYRSKRIENRIEECKDIIKATAIGTFTISGIVYVFIPNVFNGSFIFLFWILSILLTIAIRMTMYAFLIILRNQGRNLRNVVIVGTGRRAQKFARWIRERKELGYSLIGFVDNKGFDAANHIVLLSDLDRFSEVLRLHVVDEVIIGLPIKSFYEKIEEIVKISEDQGIKVRFLADLFNQRLAKSRVDHIDEVPIITLYTGALDTWHLSFKRLIDIVVSTTMLLLFSPLFIIVGIIIKLDSPGPLFFAQQRIGYNKRRFKVYKFRTMIKDAEKKQSELEQHNEMDGPVFKIKRDPRITQIGKILRKASLDELPQLFNVLKGDMSLVGPRPLPVRDYNNFAKDWQKRRFSVRPGLTCIWQIKGRNKIAFEKWMQLDMEYIDNWSLLLDAKIILKTILVLFKGSGAY